MYVESMYSPVNFVLLLCRITVGCAGSGPTERITVDLLPADDTDDRCRNASESKLCDVVYTV